MLNIDRSSAPCMAFCLEYNNTSYSIMSIGDTYEEVGTINRHGFHRWVHLVIYVIVFLCSRHDALCISLTFFSVFYPLWMNTIIK